MAAGTEYLSCADTARLLRQALKRTFSGVKFSVRSDVYAGGASIDISWNDGPTEQAVKVLADDFAAADFDAMQDLKTYRAPELVPDPEYGVREIHFGADYVFCKRAISDELASKILDRVRPLHDCHEKLGYCRCGARIGADGFFVPGGSWTRSVGCSPMCAARAGAFYIDADTLEAQPKCFPGRLLHGGDNTVARPRRTPGDRFSARG